MRLIPEHAIKMARAKNCELFTNVFGCVLPDLPLGVGLNATALDVMRVCFFHTRELGATKVEAIRVAARLVRAAWLRENKEVINENSVVARIGKLYTEFDSLRKATSTKCFEEKLAKFQDSLQSHFDIGRRGHGQTPPNPKVKRAALSLAEKGRVRKPRRILHSDMGDSTDSAVELEEAEARENSDEEFTIDDPLPSDSVALDDCVDREELLLGLDRAHISSRDAFRNLSMAARYFRLDIKSLKISRTSIRRKRKRARNSLWLGIKESFKPSGPLTVHWDGIKVSRLRGRGKVKRLPVIVTGKGVDQILGGNIIDSSSGDSQCGQIVKDLTEWQCVENVSAPTPVTGLVLL
ncbi:Threonine--tRNA ligase [Frankliniella fusca]|uniref:Threonine--tRNA ligase n=1 Tax=Frankliniella fusca TaxID=407009 RepID=A0AAE1HNN6_9NEOP|nr:Threonine--tRNA ligase [Frankliniella fusca]